MSASIDIRQTFFQECEELLEALDDGLAALCSAAEAGSADPETVNAVFRAVHSIKGGGAAFGLETLVRFAHHFETSLDAVRSGRLRPGPDILRVFLRSADYLAGLVAAARDDEAPASQAGPDLVRRLTEMVPGSETRPAPEPLPDEPAPDMAGFQPIALSFDFAPLPAATGHRIRFAATAQLYAVGHDPAHIFRALEELGPIETQADTSALPPLAEMDWSEAYLGWDIALRTVEPVEAVREVFEFVEGLSSLEIDPLDDGLSAEPAAPATGGAGPSPQAPTPSPVDTSPVRPDRVERTSQPGRPGTLPPAGPKGSVRVDLDLVDRLINIVGELVINQAVLAQCVQDAGIAKQSDVGTSLDEFRNLARELQENVMAIRAQSVKPLFQRMARIVREASDLAGKSVQFETEGEAVEVDKTVIEKLVDPLTHIIRNAIDHGLEAPAVRRAAGKAEAGRVRLTAAHRSGRVLIEVSDDGAGIDRPKVRQIAVAKGLIPADAVLDDG